MILRREIGLLYDSAQWSFWYLRKLIEAEVNEYHLYVLSQQMSHVMIE